MEPEQWDQQLKFWSQIIKRWGIEANVLDFTVEELSKALVYRDLLPPLQPSLNLLVRTKVIQAREVFLSPPSVLASLSTGMVSLIFNPDPPPSDSYVFQANVRERVQRIADQILSRAGVITDVCCTRDDLFAHDSDADVELICAELNRSKQFVERRPNGYLFITRSWGKIDREMVDAILSTKTTIARIEKQIEAFSEQISREYEKARQYKSQGRNPRALQCLRTKKVAEGRVSQLLGLKSQLDAQLDRIANGDITARTVEHLREFSRVSKIPKSDDIEELMEAVDETRAAGEELARATGAGANIEPEYDPELERELEALLAQEPDEPPRTHSRPVHGGGFRTPVFGK
jgi:hypothetical protein